MKQKKNTPIYILITAMLAAFLLTVFLFLGIIKMHQNYSEHLIKCIYIARPQAASTLINAMLNDNFLDRYMLNDNLDYIAEAAFSYGYTEELPSYIRRQYIKKLSPYIVVYIIIMAVICFVIVYYFLVIKKKSERKAADTAKELETLKLKYDMNDFAHEKREAELRQFIENVAHQIKTPLSVLITDIEMEASKETQMIQTEKIRQLLDMLLKIARLEAGKVNFERNDENVVNLLCNICSKLAEHYHNISPDNQYHISIYASGEDNDCFFKYALLNGNWYDEQNERNVTPDELEKASYEYRAWFDYEWMQEALLNVIENSFKHSDDAAVKDINISISQNPDEVIITISDSGNGIPAQYTERIFDRFFTGGVASYESTGIGLNLSKLIITQSGGDIRLKQIDNRQYFVITIPKYSLLKRRDI